MPIIPNAIVFTASGFEARNAGAQELKAQNSATAIPLR
jgi:hypothetical protein